MESFHWDKHFITGLPIVDEQHHHIVDIFNQFGDHLAKDKIVFSEIKEVFKELFDYANYHFKEEEKMMSRIGVDQRHLDLHIEAHQYFLDEVTSMHAAISPDNLHTTTNMLDFFTRWLAYHILGADQNMAKQIKAIQSGANPDDAYAAEEQRTADSTEPLVLALALALASLFPQVTTRNKELTQLNKSLEAKVTERTKALSDVNLHLEKLSMTDALTELPNCRHTMQQLTDSWDESSTSKLPLACIMIDAVHFKEVTDTYDHDAGDAVLRELASTLQQTVQSDNIVCRLGGDEFLISCPETDKQSAIHIAERVRQAVSKLLTKTSEEVWRGSVSAGVAARSPDMKNHENLIKAADMSVYEAKRVGKNCVKAAS